MSFGPEFAIEFLPLPAEEFSSLFDVMRGEGWGEGQENRESKERRT
jgi:hypothetical protein